MNIVIFDLDGCIADDRRRLPLLPENPTSCTCYDAYHADCLNDPVINRGEVDLSINWRRHIVFLTARPRKVMPSTVDWLAKHFPRLDQFTLLMRPNDDLRLAPELKCDLFERKGLAWSHVVAAYDDREDVLKAYIQRGANFTYLMKPPD